ncbi:MAG: hypothetical protein WCA53_32125, partial [Caballeronia sp.]
DADLAAYFATVTVWKGYIHKYEVEWFFGTTPQCARPVVRYAGAVSHCLCDVGEHVRTPYVVVDK